MRAPTVILDDLMLSQRQELDNEPSLLGLAPRAIVMARILVHEGRAQLTEGVHYFPDAARPIVLRIAKAYRKGRVPGISRLDLMHRLVYLANRCERYRHVDAKQIFLEGEKAAITPAS